MSLNNASTSQQARLPRLTLTSVVLSDSSAILTLSQILSYFLTIAPTLSRTLTFPIAEILTQSYLTSTVSQGDAFPVLIRNTGSATVTLVVPAGNATLGNVVIGPGTNKSIMIRVDSVSSYTLVVLGSLIQGSAVGNDAYPFNEIDFNTDSNPFGPVAVTDREVFFVTVPLSDDTYVIQLPAVSVLAENKKKYIFKDSGNASSARVIRIQATATNTINPASGTNGTGDFFDIRLASTGLALLANPSSATAWEVV